MKLGINLCACVLTSKDPRDLMRVVDEGIRLSHLQEDESTLLNSIQTHFQDFGVIPDKESLRESLPAVLIEMLPSTPPEPLAFYIREIKKRALNIMIEETIRGTIDSIKVGDTDAALSTMKEMVHKAIQQSMDGGQGVDLSSNADTRFKEYTRLRDLRAAGLIDGLPTPWPLMNEVTLGWHPGELTAFVGRVGVGKSWALLSMVISSWDSGKTPLIVTNEMSAAMLGRRLDAMIARLGYSEMTRGQLGSFGEAQYKHLIEVTYPAMGSIICVGAPKIKTTSDLAMAIRTYRPDGGVFVDGINRLRAGKSTDRYQRVAEAADDLKGIAEATEVPIIGTTHFHRKGGKTAKKSTDVDMEDIGYAYAISEQADNLFGLLQTVEMKEERQFLIKFLKLREQAPIEGMLTELNLETMRFGQIAEWRQGDIVRPEEDEEGEVQTVHDEDGN